MNCGDLAELLSGITAFIARFVVLSQPQLNAVSLWVAHTHFFDAADSTPYLSITSAEMRCGKSRLLEVLALLVCRPWLTARVSAAILPRKIDAEHPTLLLDESDAAFGGQKDYAEALRGILNSGHRRGNCVSLCAGQGAKITYQNFDTFCPKAIAGIGRLPDTIADRAIPIRLKRRVSHECVERFRHRDARLEAIPLIEDLGTISAVSVDMLRNARPGLPEVLGDRQQDAIEPLLAIADLAGGTWPEKSRTSLVDLFGVEPSDASSVRVRLLGDIRAALRRRVNAGVEKDGRIASKELVRELTSDETLEWVDVDHGKALSPSMLAKLLKPYGISPKTIRLGNETLKGYELVDFKDAWDRYLPRDETCATCLDPHSGPSQPSQSDLYRAGTPTVVPSLHAHVTGMKSDESLMNMPLVAGVTSSMLKNELGAVPFDSETNCYTHGPHVYWWQRGEDSVCGLCHPKP